MKRANFSGRVEKAQHKNVLNIPPNPRIGENVLVFKNPPRLEEGFYVF